jgi:hypothetical protein
MDPLKTTLPLTAIAMRASICGVITCCVLAFVSHQLEVCDLINTLHHKPTQVEKGSVQFAIFTAGVIVAFWVDKKDLWRSHQMGGRRGVWRSVVYVLGFFALGFVVIGMMLPSHT